MADSEALKSRGLQGRPERRMASLSSSDMDLHISIQIKSLDVRLTVFVCTAHPKKIY